MKSLVSVSFSEAPTEAMAAQMPAEQAHVRSLIEQGVIQALHIAADRSHVWLVLEGESPDHVRQTMTTFPLYRYMHIEVTPLMEIEPPVQPDQGAPHGRGQAAFQTRAVA